MNTTSYHLHDMPLGVAAFDLGFLCASPQLTAPALLTVGYDYTAPRLPAMYLANGDPGDEPGDDEALEILMIESAAPLHFADREEGVLVTLVAGPGRDLRGYFTDSGLIVIELGVLAIRRGDAGQARLDRYEAGQP